MDKLSIENDTSFRTKAISSVYKKNIRYLDQKKISDISDYSKIHDLLGIRVLVHNVGECYRVLSHIHRTWDHVPDEFDDYIENPKPSGYKSLQTAICLPDDTHCEIQIRTFEMHEYNEYGPASHFLYKYSTGSKDLSASWIKELISMKETLQSEIAKSSDIKLFEDTIFVFTPENDLIVLPAKSTPVDFAYAVHTDVGDTCTGAKVNGKIEKLDHQLESGQTVEILTKRTHTPPVSWLDFVQTAEAKKHIKKYLA